MKLWQKVVLDKYINYHELANEEKNHDPFIARQIYTIKAAAMHEVLEEFNIDANKEYEKYLQNKKED